MNRALRSHLAGFTLIELLVAMVIFAIMSTAMYSVFNSFQITKEITDRDAHRLADLQRFFGQFGREIQQAVMRPVGDEFASETHLPALQGTLDTLEFTRAGWNLPPFVDTQRSELQRVGYTLEEGGVVRLQWLVLDRASDTQPIRTPMLENVRELRFRYFTLDQNRQIQEVQQWPTDQLGGNNSSQQKRYWPLPAREVTLPVMVEITLELPDLGKISRRYALPGKRDQQSSSL
ncbi:General secretion pathway protein J [gamma proteobacterium HdN1]|nr:General secretion pathway protein J [gamma proteobacterium HdN1]